MNVTFAATAFALALAAFPSAPVQAAAPVELNVRTDVGNASRNRVASARLQAMLTDGDSRGASEGIGNTSEDDCTTQIGNNEASGSLFDRHAPIIIVAPVINVCL